MKFRIVTGLVLALLLVQPTYAQQFLKQSTASQSRKLCGFVDSTDGNTEESALSIANTDIKISKNGGAFGNKNSGGGTYDAVGCYTITLDATDTATVGPLVVAVHMSGALPVYAYYTVVEEAIYDGLYGASAGTSTTILPVNTTQLAGTAQTGRDIGASVLLSSGTGTGQISLSSGTVTAGTVGTGAISEASFATTAGSFAPLGVVDQGTAQAATGTTLQLRSAATFADDQLIGATCVITGGSAGVGQARVVTDYMGSTDTATVDTWTTTPTGTITYKCFGTAPSSGSGSAPSAATIADAVWDEATSGHTTAGTFGKAVSDILVDTGTTLDGKLDTIDSVADAIKAKTDSLTFTVTGQVDANTKSMNDVEILGSGTTADPWNGE